MEGWQLTAHATLCSSSRFSMRSFRAAFATSETGRLLAPSLVVAPCITTLEDPLGAFGFPCRYILLMVWWVTVIVGPRWNLHTHLHLHSATHWTKLLAHRLLPGSLFYYPKPRPHRQWHSHCQPRGRNILVYSVLIYRRSEFCQIGDGNSWWGPKNSALW